METSAIVSVLFRVINFGMISFVLGYLFKKYGVPALQQMMRDRQQITDDLTREWLRLHTEGIAAVRAVQEQEHECVYLKQQIDVWRDAHAERALAQQREATVIMEQAMALRQQRAHSLAAQAVRKRAGILALQQAEEALKKQFAQEVQGAEYLYVVIDQLKRGRHE